MLQPTGNIVKNIIGVYATPLLEVSAKAMFTNTTPVGAYRGAGRPEGNYYMERLLDTAAREMGIDRVEMRRRNHIQPEAMPYKTPSGMVYDSGDFPAILDKALALADWDGFAARAGGKPQHAASCAAAASASIWKSPRPPAPEMGGIRFEDDGTVTIITGTLDYGQGHASPFAQVLASTSRRPVREDQAAAGRFRRAARRRRHRRLEVDDGERRRDRRSRARWCIENGRKIAAHVLEAGRGRHRVRVVAAAAFSHRRHRPRHRHHGTGRTAACGPCELPDGRAGRRCRCRHVVRKARRSAFPNGCHVAEVEVDPETGVAEVVSYAMVNDFGVLVNPMLVEGQAHGGIVQGIGQALMERVVYDEDGQLLTGSYMDYALPRADDAPCFAFDSHPVPAQHQPAGRQRAAARRDAPARCRR